jgi:hypothetical protein
MFLTVLAVKESLQEPIKIHQSQNPIVLSFTKINVKCLSLVGSPETDIWILDNYFNSVDDLTREEQIAFRVFVSKKIDDEKSKNQFLYSPEYQQLLVDERYRRLSENDKQFIENNYDDLRKFKKEQEEAKNILKTYKQKYDKRIFLHLKDSDPFINAAFVKYGWAITVHKATASTYNEIIIKGHRKEYDGIANESYFRWLYSGVTAGKKVYITSPQIINPFMDCVFEDISVTGVNRKPKQFLNFENYEVDIKFADKVQSIQNKNVVGCICEISKVLEQHGYLLESCKMYSEYLTKAFYSIPQSDNKQLILNIDNKGSKDNFTVSNIRIENLNGADEIIVKMCIEDCFKQKQSFISISDDKPELPQDFRKEIYTAWFENCKNESITLKLMQSHNNQDVFHATCKTESLTFRVWYGTSEKNHTKGFFSKIEILDKSSESILEKVKSIVYGL